MTGQTSASPFMNIREGTGKRVSFNTKDELGDKIDKLTVVMSKLAVKTVTKGDPLSHRYIKVGDKIGHIIKEDIGPGQMIETRVMV